SRLFSGSKTVRIYVTVGPKFISTGTLTVSAVARGDVVFNPTELDFGTAQQGAKTVKTVDVEYGGNMVNWAVTEIVKNATAPFDLKVEELPRLVGAAPRKGYRLVATMKPDAPAGSFKQELVLKTNDPTTPVLTINVAGNVQAGLAVSPSPVLISG